METLNIKGTSYTPEVTFDVDNNIYSIKGDSRPEDTHAFYQILIDWLSSLKNSDIDKGKVNGNDALFKFQFDYLNSSSSKFILKLIMCIKELQENGFNFRIEWYFDQPDIDMRELGEEYKDMLGMEIKLIPIEI